MATVSIRYLVDDVDSAIAFYCHRLGFHEQMHPAPAFAMLTRGDLRLLLSAAGGEGPGGGSQAMPDGRTPEPGGWNRFTLEVDDLETTVRELRQEGVRFRNDIVTGVGGKQVLVEDPSGNLVELFEPMRAEARLDAANDHPPDTTFRVRPIGWVESTLIDAVDAPNQGEQGAPDAWLALNPDVHEGARDLSVGSDIIVLTWLHQSRRDELTTQPGDDPTGPERGVFSTRSPARPNPVGIHRVSVIAIEGNRLRVGPIEAIDGTPLLDIKPLIRADTAWAPRTT
ncbi:MAG: tRNA (N6-threonylcarbamoyladenosine(37)-N6)-methyltransferase TrmO [Humibacillus sp.]|nr:tRNA (N6-threonylcarbamoyladenosine(37)-N6)-methyltransferase TrmO [Humibacillus sp.]MDN5776268.1 tRNA (N6-threonylcarbamoyladenosine(37)-N6)-methyltransferase TrmO [Humibacillus sp.]